NQNGSTVPIANIPTKAIASAIQDIRPTLTVCSFSLILVVGVTALPRFTAFVAGFRATAVALLAGATIASALANLVELRLLTGTAGAGIEVAVIDSCSMNMVAMTRR